jgi:Rrf2 family nitric oxide-sensitive transcriptional repressor
VECVEAEHNSCLLDGYCRLKWALQQAMASYLQVLDGVTLADLVAPMAQPQGARLGQPMRVVPGLPRLALL